MRRLLSLLLFAATPAWAMGAPTPVPQPPPLPAPQDKPFPGVIELMVDATNLSQHIVRIEETVPVPPGEPLTLLFPRWLPGNHAPSGPLPLLAGLTVTAEGKPVAWRRDPVDMGAFAHGPRQAPARSLRTSPISHSRKRLILGTLRRRSGATSQ